MRVLVGFLIFLSPFLAGANETCLSGLSLDLGGIYTWMSFTTPPTYSGNTGGVQGKLTYQAPQSYFGQARSVYNLGKLSSSLNKTNESEWYLEFLGGYCFSLPKNWTFAPYAGLGFDYLHDNQTGYSTFSPIGLHYRSYYAIFGFDAHYSCTDWTAGVQADCFPIFNQYLAIAGLSGAYWSLSQRIGAAARLPVAYRLIKNCWLELAPYYRFMPIGDSPVLVLPERNLQEWGVFATFRVVL